MLEIGVQSRNVVEDSCPEKGFRMLKDAGFSCTDFSLNSYLTNKDLYEGKVNAFFSQSIQELEQFFSAHKEGAKKKARRRQESGSIRCTCHIRYIYRMAGKKSMIFCRRKWR